MLSFETAIEDTILTWAKTQGLSLAMSSPRAARLESENVFLQFLFDNGRSYLLVVELGQKGPQERPFGLHEVLKMNKSPDERFLTALTPMGQETLSAALDNIKKWLEQFALALLQNDAAAFTKLQAFRKSACMEMAEPKKMRAARAEAKALLEKGNPLGYIRVMRTIEIILTPSERQELARAEKQVLWG